MTPRDPISLAIVLVVVAKLYAASSAGRGFLSQYPCVPLSLPCPPSSGGAHLLTFFLLVIIVRLGRTCPRIIRAYIWQGALNAGE